MRDGKSSSSLHADRFHLGCSGNVAAPDVVRTPAAVFESVSVAVMVCAGLVSTSLTTMSSSAMLAAPSV